MRNYGCIVCSVLALKKIPYELKTVDLLKGEQVRLPFPLKNHTIINVIDSGVFFLEAVQRS